MLMEEKKFIKHSIILSFFSITLFYFFESAQMSYFNVLAPFFLNHHLYDQSQIASLSAAYYYGDMLGLLPAGLALDRFPLRKILLFAIFASVISAFLLITTNNFYLSWVARFLCGFFGGTFSFIGGIRILASLFADRFTFYMGIFLSAGMFAGLVAQHPVLWTVKNLGVNNTMLLMALFGLVVYFINIFYLRVDSTTVEKNEDRTKTIKNLFSILINFRNWCDCLMIVLLDIPVSVIGTLWGSLVLMSVYHFSDTTSAWIIMSLFLGLMIGSPLWGKLADHYHHSAWIIIVGGFLSGIISVMMLFLGKDPGVIALLFFTLGLFSSCQTLGFTWLTKNMRPELISLNSAINSMIFMGTNGGFKQLAGSLLVTSSLIPHLSSASNLILLTAAAMLLASIYAISRESLFYTKQKIMETEAIAS